MDQAETIGSVRSVNVGRPRDVEWRGRAWRTAIFKEPVDGPVRVEGVQMSGDQQADLTVHGGPTKAVYAYPAEHYEFWRATLASPQRDALATCGAFGENLTVEGILEAHVGVGDVLRVGTASLRVTEPRMPCSKLGLRFGDPLMTRRFHEARRNGFYFAIDAPGEIRAGDAIFVESRHPQRLTIQEIVDAFTGQSVADGLRARAQAHPELSESWRSWFAGVQA